MAMADLDDLESKLTEIHYALMGTEGTLQEINTNLEEMVKLLKTLVAETKKK